MVMPVSVTGAAVAATARVGRSKRGDGRVAAGFLAPSMIGLLAFTAFPIVASLIIGFYNWPVIGRHTFTAWKNYRLLLDSTEFKTAIINTLIFVILYVPINIVISLGIALWCGPKIKLRGLYRTIFFLPSLVPFVGSSLLFLWLLNQMRGLDRRMSDGFADMHRQFGEVQKQFGDVHRQFGEVHRELGEVRAEIAEVRADLRLHEHRDH